MTLQTHTAYLLDSLQHAEFLAALSDLLESNDRLARHTASSRGFAFLDPVGSASRDQVAQALGDLWYQDGQSAAQSTAYPGVVAGDLELVTLAQAANSARCRYQEAVAHLRGMTRCDAQGRSRTMVRELLTDRGQARLNHRMAVRQIPILDFYPRRIAFTWAHVDSVERISVDQANRRLLRAGLARSDEARALARVPEHEPLAWLRPKPPRPRVNVYGRSSQAPHQWQALVPLIYLGSNDRPAPRVQASQRSAQRRPRKRSRLERHPLLPSVSVYRYQAPIRAVLMADTKV